MRELPLGRCEMACGALAGPVFGRRRVTTSARAIGGVTEDELGTEGVAGLAGYGLGRRPRILVTGIVAGVATRCRQVVAARTLDRHVTGQVRFARVGEGLVRR